MTITYDKKLLRAMTDQLPGYVFVRNAMQEFTVVNEPLAKLLEYDDPEAIFGAELDCLNFSSTELEKYAHDDELVLRSKQPLLNIEETQTQKLSEHSVAVITSKYPIFDRYEKAVGLIGMFYFPQGPQAELVKIHVLAQQLPKLNLLHSQKQYAISNNHELILLNRREIACANYLVLGHTAKSMGLKMHISYRTIEVYLRNLRQRFGVSNKSDLIRAIMQSSLLSFMIHL